MSPDLEADCFILSEIAHLVEDRKKNCIMFRFVSCDFQASHSNTKAHTNLKIYGFAKDLPHPAHVLVPEFF